MGTYSIRDSLPSMLESKAEISMYVSASGMTLLFSLNSYTRSRELMVPFPLESILLKALMGQNSFL